MKITCYRDEKWGTAKFIFDDADPEYNWPQAYVKLIKAGHAQSTVFKTLRNILPTHEGYANRQETFL